MKNAKFSQTSIVTALNSANSAYIARKGASANLNKSGFNPDINKALQIVALITDAQIKAISALEIDAQIIAGLKDATNTKKPMRTLQALMFTITGNGAYLKGSARTFLIEFCALVIAGAKTRSALAYSATGKGDDSTSDEINVTKARMINRAFGAIGVSTEQTQNSVSFSKGGIAETLGIARKTARQDMPVIDLSNKVAQALNAMVAGMTDSKINLIVAQASGK